MKVWLAYPDRDFDVQAPLPANAEMLQQDLGLDSLFGAMAAGDTFVYDIARVATLTSLTDIATIRYRQAVLQDWLGHPSLLRELYALAIEGVETQKQVWRSFVRYPEAILSSAVDLLKLLVEALKKLRRFADAHIDHVHSPGVTRLFEMLRTELDDAYFEVVDAHLRQLKFRGGVLMSARLGNANKGTAYVLLPPQHVKRGWRDLMWWRRSEYTWSLPERDDAGAHALGELRGRGINLVANAVAQSADHVVSFFDVLRTELAWYVGCLNVHEALTRKGEPTCFPDPSPVGTPTLTVRDLYDAPLTLRQEDRLIGNDVDADGKGLVMITGANQGGKSTLLRAIGVGQLMMQAGMFVPATSFRANICNGLFTHFKREEDTTMISGKFDEELHRMSDIADQVRSGSIALFNESFASTNESEGSTIARQVVRALLECGVRVFFVTHMFDLARRFELHEPETTLFLRAERLPDGRRTFKLLEGAPLPTSYGVDLFKSIIGNASDDATPVGSGPNIRP